MVNSISIKTQDEIKIMQKGGRILAKIMDHVKSYAKEGMTTKEIEKYAASLMAKYNVRPSFKNYKGYPNCTCISINEEWVHGIPSAKKFKNGDLVSVDIGIYYKGFATDMAITFGIGEIDKSDQRLIRATKAALSAGIKQAREGNRIGDISAAIQKEIEKANFSVMREYSGHGVGKNPHEAPDIPDYGEKGTGPEIKNGMVFALEPMAAKGNSDIEISDNGWTVSTKDRKKTAHFEHTIAVTTDGPVVLTNNTN